MPKYKHSIHIPSMKDIIFKIKKVSYIEIFIVTSIIALTFFVIKYFGIKSTWQTIRVEVIKKNWTENYDPFGYRTPFWISDKLKIGHKELSKSGKVIAEIVDMENFERGYEESDMYITIKIKSTYNKRDKTYLYKDKYLVNLGNAIEFNFNNIGIRGQIIDNDVPKDGYPKKEIEVTLELKYLEDWYIKLINVGDKMYNRATGEKVFEITNIESSISKFTKQYGPDGYIIKEITHDKTLKDLRITAKIKAYKLDGKWYFNGHQNVKTSNMIFIFTDNYNINGSTIIKIAKE